MLQVVAGIVVNKNREILIALRPLHVHCGGCWEFPGGKIQGDETPPEALARELNEELGIDITDCSFLYEVEHEYPDQKVHLQLWHVTDFKGEAYGREGQEIAWVNLSDLDKYSFPAANQKIIPLVIAKL